MANEIGYEWVIGVYTGDQAKTVKAQADVGIGYFFQREGGRGQTYTVYAAFRRPLDGARADHLELANSQQVEKLDRLWDRRHGVKDEHHPQRSATSPMLFKDVWQQKKAQRKEQYAVH